MKVAFLKGTGYIDYAIRLWTFSQYSHCEMVFSDGQTIGVDLILPPTVTRRTMRYNANWDLIDLDIPCDREERIRFFVTQQLGKAYDWKGIFLSQVLPFKSEDPDKWFCSELCMAAFKFGGYFPDEISAKVSPKRFNACIKPLQRVSRS